MKNPFKKSSASADIAAELTRLKGKRVDAERRVELAGQDLAAAKAARMESLDGDDATIEAATNRIRAAQSAVSETDELVRDFDLAIAGAEQRLVAAQDREAREAEAKKLEKVAAAIEKRRPDFEKAIEALVNVVEAISREIPPEMGVASGFALFRKEDTRGRRSGHPLSGYEAILAAVVDAICAELSDSETKWYIEGRRQSGLARLFPDGNGGLSYGAFDGIPKPMRAGPALDTFLIDRLRAQAKASSRDEKSDEVLTISPPSQKEPEREAVAEVEIIATDDFAFVASVNAMGKGVHQIAAERARHRIPEPVAVKAVGAGLAYLLSSPEGQRLHEQEQERLARPMVSYREAPKLEDCVDLGDVMNLECAWHEERIPLRPEEAEEAGRAVG